MATQTHKIPDYILPELKSRLEKLNKRAVKLGCEPLELVVHNEYFQSKGGNSGFITPKFKMFEISIEGAAPKLAGWTFVGTLDHYSLPGKVIVNTVPGETIPKCFHESAAICDHCNTIRNRKETFIVKNEDKIWQVGRQCLKDFLGHNPQGLASFMTSVKDLFDEIDNCNAWGGEEYFEVSKLLAITNGVIREFGWTPRNSATETVCATAAHVTDYLYPPKGGTEYTVWKIFVNRINVSDNDYLEATNAIEWLKTQDANNEYMHNIKAIGDSNEVNLKLIGFTCSIIAAYHRAQEKLKLATQEKRLNEYLTGEPKQRLELLLTLNFIHTIENDWGTTRIHNFVDQDGRSVIWFASKDSGMEEKKEYKVKATIKEFGEYKELKQTKVTRVAVQN